jgi:hypothetical protein
MFALVPEDTHCPLEVLLLMYKAVHEGSTATIMHIRKYLRILINRSLVLGTIDRPSVHDLVLDFAVAQHSDQDLLLKHRQVVEAFRAVRPADAHGRCMYDSTQMDDPVSVYVGNEIRYHVEHSLVRESSEDNPAVLEWLTDMPQDAIVIATGQELGVEHLTQLADAAESAGDWWLAARYWSVVREVIYQQSGNGAASEAASKALHATAQMSDTDHPQLRDDLRFEQAVTIITAFDVPTLNRRLKELDAILKTEAALREPARTTNSRLFLAFTIPAHGDWTFEQIGDSYFESITFVRTAERSATDPQQKVKCALMAIAIPHSFELCLFSKAFDWDFAYGKDAQKFFDAHRAYNYDQHHAFLISSTNGDYLHTMTAYSPVLQVRYLARSPRLHLRRLNPCDCELWLLPNAVIAPTLWGFRLFCSTGVMLRFAKRTWIRR